MRPKGSVYRAEAAHPSAEEAATGGLRTAGSDPSQDTVRELERIEAEVGQVEQRLRGLPHRLRYALSLAAAFRFLAHPTTWERWRRLKTLLGTIAYACAGQGEALTRALMACDGVLSMGDHHIRRRRKALVSRIQSDLEAADALKERANEVVRLHMRLEREAQAARAAEAATRPDVGAAGRHTPVTATDATAFVASPGMESEAPAPAWAWERQEDEGTVPGTSPGPSPPLGAAHAPQGPQGHVGPWDRGVAGSSGDHRFGPSPEKDDEEDGVDEEEEEEDEDKDEHEERLRVPLQYLPQWEPEVQVLGGEPGDSSVSAQVDLAGVDPADVRVTVEEGGRILRVRGVRYPTEAEWRSHRSHVLPGLGRRRAEFGTFDVPLDVGGANAERATTRWLENGVLELTVPLERRQRRRRRPQPQQQRHHRHSHRRRPQAQGWEGGDLWDGPAGWFGDGPRWPPFGGGAFGSPFGPGFAV